MSLFESDGHVGFTGTQQGMTDKQKTDLRKCLRGLKQNCGVGFFHHGDCLGADAEAHDIAKELGYRIIIHPPDNPSKRAFKSGDETRPHLPYMERNAEIVREAESMIAAPKEQEEQLRSGTWSTVRKTRKSGKPLLVLNPK